MRTMLQIQSSKSLPKKPLAVDWLLYLRKDNKKAPTKKLPLSVVRPEGLEPPTFRFVAERSIQLSYERI